MSKDAAKNFADDWYGHGYEKGETQKFWLALLRKVLDVDEPDNLIDFERSVKIDGQTKFIDGYITRTKVLIEQKKLGADLTDALDQATRYADALPDTHRPRWIVTCNFAEFRIYNVTENFFVREPVVIKLRDLRYQYRRLKFLVDPAADTTPPEEKISADAAKIIEKICLTFDKNYRKSNDVTFRDALSKFCTRLVFCFYADDADIFTDAKFGDYLKKFSVPQLHDALQKFFVTLNTPTNHRPDTLDPALKNFPYVNGGLFDESLNIPPLTHDLKLAIEHAHILRADFNQFIKFSWREIDPSVFGAMFESVVNSQRVGGMYYTSTANIHKVIDPLFLDDLRDEFDAINRRHITNRPKALLKLQDKLASLNFFDPACGSGNFLTETYLSLRRLENEILEQLRNLYVPLPDNPVKVSIRQFYGIEIDPFAVAVAQTALWIAETQMLHETEGAIGKNLRALPLTKYVTVVCANALRIDWADVVAPANVSYIIGNPPYAGARLKSAEQAADIQRVFAGWNNIGNLDYVACWFKKAVDFMAGKKIRAAFVSTNSVCQGDSVGVLWKKLFDSGVHIDFAHQTFKWLSDSENMAHVHCVVVGFSVAPNVKPKKIFVEGQPPRVVDNINAYLVDGENIFVESRNTPLQDGVPEIGIGNKPIDGGNYLFTPEEMFDFIRDEPAAKNFFRPWFGAEEFIRGKKRFCLWLGDLSDDEIDAMPLCRERVEAVRNYRRASKSAGTRKISDKPTRFHVENFPHEKFLVMAKTSSGERQYIPMDFMNDSVLCSDKVFILPNATLYHFGMLTSSIHMAWMRATNCPLGTSYSYSIAIVYNNFPWPDVTATRRRMIEQTAQKILDVRADFATWTFAALYDEETMPDELRLAHKSNDYAVAMAYGYEKFLDDEPRVVAALMKRYKQLTT